LSAIYLDTHVAIWLCAGQVENLTSAAKEAVEESPLLISPMVYLEFSYLYRRRRVAAPAATIFATLNTSFGVNFCSLPFPSVAGLAAEMEWTDDPFDRMIVAQAQCNGMARLVTADSLIRTHYERAVW